MNSDARVFELGDGETNFDGNLAVREQEGNEVFAVLFELGESEPTTTTMSPARPVLTDGPHVMHWVVDTRATAEIDRVRAYVDGNRVLAVRVYGAAVPMGSVIRLGPGERRATLGRPHTTSRINRSRIWYVAVYNRALTDVEIADRAPAILADDDRM